MARLILAIIAFAMAIAVLKMVIVALVIAGLIFRTKETIGLLLLGGLLTLIAAQPLLGLGLLAVIIIAAIVKAARNDSQLPGQAPALTAPVQNMDDPDQE